MGAGGVRPGAGRPGWHIKAEHCRRIDVRRWHREALLRPGVRSSWVWTDSETGERLASIGFSVTEHQVELFYNMNDTPMRQYVPLERTPCNFGGDRPWFLCPRCARRVAVLHVRNTGFACRQCHRLVYASQSDDECGRAWRRQAKLEARLGPNWARPKGMHQQTHERLVAQLWNCERAREDALAEYLHRAIGSM
jgi:hypothetical protein